MRERQRDGAERGGSINSLLHRAIISSPFVTRSPLPAADGIFVSCRLDTLHYAGDNVYSLRLVATRGVRDAGTEKSGTDQTGADWSGSERIQTDRSGPERTKADWWH